ncbi:MAG: hypothetical protein IJO57_00960 [Bacilli bacterium]|nr:hypothetical protein [Bacilli bacterium]
MVDQIVELENGENYVILDKTDLDERTFYYALRLDDKEQPTKNYLFFEELKSRNDVYFDPVEDEDIKGALLVAFSINYLNMVYDL